MNDSEIINALEICSTKGSCKDCPCISLKNCSDIAVQEAIAFINRQQAEIDRLNIELKAMRGAANGFKAEVEKLKNSPIIGTLCPMWKAEAVREFAERLKVEDFDRCIDVIYDGNGEVKRTEIRRVLFNKQIDNLVKEMGCNDG